jgi:ribosomal-protein-alanine N-acetyltransferase
VVAVVKRSAPTLRPMRLEDVDEIARIEAQAYEFPWTPGIFRDCLRAGYGSWVLASAEQIIGYGVLSVAAMEAHVLNVCIAPQMQGQGHGRRLMKRLVDLARWHQAQRIFLEVRPSNPRAIALYEDMGFNQIGQRPNYYPAKKGREDALVLALELLKEE